MPKYAEEILAAVTELQQHPTAEQVFLEMKKGASPASLWVGISALPAGSRKKDNLMEEKYHER